MARRGCPDPGGGAGGYAMALSGSLFGSVSLGLGGSGGVGGIGNNLLIQEVYGRGQTWHMTQFWLNQSFFDETMTAQDILEGRMNVEIGLAAVRPAEFIILRFSHKLQES